MLTFSQVALALAAIWFVVLAWQKLGDPEYLENRDPGFVKLIGAKLIRGENGRIYVEPPPPRKRLQLSLILGLILAILYAYFIKWLGPL